MLPVASVVQTLPFCRCTCTEAPATTGILSLYNQGTRRQLYWPCRGCGEFFVTRVKDLHWADGAKSDDATIAAWFACPSCGTVHEDDDRRKLWQQARWVGEGETIRRDGIVEGALRNVSIDSYWLFGPQARFRPATSRRGTPPPTAAPGSATIAAAPRAIA